MMRFSFRPNSSGEEDLFSPLRELHSPISKEAIKALVFHHAASGFTAWNYLWSIAGGVLAIGAVAGVLYHFSGNEPAKKSSVATKSSISSEQIVSSSIPENTSPENISENSHSNVSNYTSHVQPDISQSPASENANDDVAENISYLEARSLPIENLGIKSTDTPIENPLLTSYFLPITSPELYATASSGAIFSHLRILGESAEIGVNNGWESAGIAFTNASGKRDLPDVIAHHASATSLLFSESDQTIALLFGANYSIGPVAMKGELGPAYIISSSKFIDPVTEVLGSSNVNNRIGMAAEISALYSVSDFFQAGVTSISSYRTGQFTSGLLISVSIRP